MRNYTRYGLTCLIMICVVCGCKPSEQKAVRTRQPTQLTITYETSSTNGRYSPRNVHAVWVEHADGTFIKTLDLWANKRARHLTQWAAATGDMANDVQARTGATQKAYGAYSSHWDMKDANGRTVPNGDYIIRFELTSDNAPKNRYHRASVPFTKSNTTGTTIPIDLDGYKNIVLDCHFVAETD